MTPLMILVAGPYRSGTSDDPQKIQANVDAMMETALRLFRAGHLPVLGEWYALPLIEYAGSRRIGGPSVGADEMVSLARQNGKLVFHRFDDIPGCAR